MKTLFWRGKISSVRFLERLLTVLVLIVYYLKFCRFQDHEDFPLYLGLTPQGIQIIREARRVFGIGWYVNCNCPVLFHHILTFNLYYCQKSTKVSLLFYTRSDALALLCECAALPKIIINIEPRLVRDSVIFTLTLHSFYYFYSFL